MFACLYLDFNREDIEYSGAGIVFEEDLQVITLFFWCIYDLHLRASWLCNWKIEKSFLASYFRLCESILDLTGLKFGLKIDEDDCALDDVDA